MQLIGLTGGIASGKSTASSHLLLSGIPVIDADQIAQHVMQSNPRAVRLIVDSFGAGEVLDPNTGEIDRIKLGALIFANHEARAKLNAIIHPLVRLLIVRKVIYYWLLGYERVILDVPLLFESKAERYTSFSILIYCDEAMQVGRLVARSKLTEAEARLRVNAQLSIDQKAQLADYVVNNSGTIQELCRDLDLLLEQLRPSVFMHRVVYHALPLALLLSVPIYLGCKLLKYL